MVEMETILVFWLLDCDKGNGELVSRGGSDKDKFVLGLEASE